jgi:hypothetical protein
MWLSNQRILPIELWNSLEENWNGEKTNQLIESHNLPSS